MYEAEIEITRVKNEFFDAVNGIRNLSRNSPLLETNDNFKIMLVPMIYALWERVFRTSTAAVIKHKFSRASSPNELPLSLLALVLQKQGFFDSFLTKIRNGSKPNSEKIRKGQFDAVSEFFGSYESWKIQKLNILESVESYVMTFSNVNEAVIRLHEEVLDSGQTRADNESMPLNISFLGEIVGIRNDIGHGSRIKAPGDKQLLEIFADSEKLVVAYTDTMVRCINQSASSRAMHTKLRGYRSGVNFQVQIL
jgi:RiboL-PSP-HEPN